MLISFSFYIGGRSIDVEIRFIYQVVIILYFTFYCRMHEDKNMVLVRGTLKNIVMNLSLSWLFYILES